MVILFIFILAILGLVFLAKAFSSSPRRAVWFWASAISWVAAGVIVFVLSEMLDKM